MVLKEVAIWLNFDAIYNRMVLKEVAVYNIVNNFANKGWIWLKFWHNVGTYKGHLWCELQLPDTLSVWVTKDCVFLTLPDLLIWHHNRHNRICNFEF